jgi:VCBS repeat-containing protein
MTASGNVLANDRDVDAGTVLKVAAPGTVAGSYGKLTLARDGSYVYALDPAKVQAMGRGAAFAEHFNYAVTDGIASAASSLDIAIAGANDAPTLAAPLADRDLTFNKAFSFTVPANSFTDSDQGDALKYSATLADGSALPSWLKFDAASGTFSGTSPKTVGSIDVRVTATDYVKADGSTQGSLATSDVFRLSVSHGNEGVGNGQDAAPAGQDTSFNDGAGTGPGNPGARQGSGGASRALVAGGAAVAVPALEPAAASLPLAVPAFAQLADHVAPASSVGNTDAAQVFGKWLAVDLAVSEAVADQKSSWFDAHAGVDAGALGAATAGLLGSTAAPGADPLAQAGLGQELKTFTGLGKGVQKIK